MVDSRFLTFYDVCTMVWGDSCATSPVHCTSTKEVQILGLNFEVNLGPGISRTGERYELKKEFDDKA